MGLLHDLTNESDRPASGAQLHLLEILDAANEAGMPT